LEDKEAFGAHIEEKVNNAEVGTKAEATGKHLIVGNGTKCGVAGRVVLRVNEFAVICRGRREAGGKNRVMRR